MQYTDKQVEIKRTVEQDKPFLGRNIDQMPLLLGEERSPWPAVRFMKERIAHVNEFPDLNDYLDVSDLIAYDSSERSKDIKFILTVDRNGRVTEKGRKALELINPYAKPTSDRAILLSNDLYDSLPGIIVAKSDLGILERDLTEEEVLESKVWRILARHPDEVSSEFAEDSDLLKEYADWVKGQTKQGTNMGVYMDNNSNKNAKLRVWCVGGLVGRYYANGWDDLGYDNSRFVGIAPEALGKDI